jgi:hypothetical protein
VTGGPAQLRSTQRGGACGFSCRWGSGALVARLRGLPCLCCLLGRRPGRGQVGGRVEREALSGRLARSRRGCGCLPSGCKLARAASRSLSRTLGHDENNPPNPVLTYLASKGLNATPVAPPNTSYTRCHRTIRDDVMIHHPPSALTQRRLS